MTMTSDVLIDWALNLTGYLAAGALPVVIWSLVTHRRRQPRPVPVTSQAFTPPPVSHGTRRPETRGGQFVSFRASGGPATEDSVGENCVAGRQDRADVIRLARQMLKAGASHQRIQQVLPVSEAELALLRYDSER